jgi:hypothetical protein
MTVQENSSFLPCSSRYWPFKRRLRQKIRLALSRLAYLGRTNRTAPMLDFRLCRLKGSRLIGVFDSPYLTFVPFLSALGGSDWSSIACVLTYF